MPDAAASTGTAMRLHGYFRSSAAFRVRIALNLKGLACESVPVHLRRGDQRRPEFLGVNPQGLVPALETDGQTLIQSLPIIEYLDETHPEPPLLPSDAAGRARVRALAAMVACDIHPLNNLRVLRYLHRTLGHDEAALAAWYNHWIAEGFGAIESLLAADSRTGRFCHGDTPGLADVVLVPQVVNAERYRLDLAPYPTIARIFEACMMLDAFAAARPERQPDFEP
jgi:maleylacetoacetate isomerase